MRLSEIPEVNLADSTQDEALSNVNAGRALGVPPSYFKSSKDILKPEYDRLPYENQEVTPVVARMIASDKETAAALAPEAKTYSTMERILGTLKNSVSGTTGPEARHRQLGYKKARAGQFGGGTLTEDEEFEYEGLNAFAKQNYGREDYGADFYESLPGQFAGALIDIPLTIQRNPKLSAAFATPWAIAGAVAGGVAGSVAGPVGALTGAAKGAAMGAGRGLGTGFIPIASYDAYQSATGETYNKLGSVTDESGRSVPVDETERIFISHGVGAASSALAIVGGKFLQKFAPILNKMKTSKYLAQMMTLPGQQGARAGFRAIGAVLSEGGEEALQEIVAIVGEEIGGTADEFGETQFWQGIERAGNKIANDPETRKRLAAAGIIGGAVGATVVRSGEVAQKAVDKVGKKAGITPSADVPVPVKPATDITPNSNDAKVTRMDAALEVQGVLEFQSFLDMQSEAVKKLPSAQKSPELVAEIRKQIGTENNLPNVWFDPDDLKTMLESDQQGPVIRDMLGPDLDSAIENSQLVQVPVEKAMAAHDLIPKLSEFVKTRPELPAPSQIESYLQAREDQATRAEAVFQELKVDQGRDPLTRAYDVTLRDGMEDTEMSAALKTQEVADGYLTRLDSEDIAYRDAGDTDALARNQILRERIGAMKAALPKDVEVEGILAQAMTDSFPTMQTFTEGDYVNQPSLVEAVNRIAPVKEAEAINTAQREARQAIADNINETAKYEMNLVISEVEAQNTEVQAQIEADKIKNDPDFAIVDRFMRLDETWFPSQRFRTVGELTDAHAKPGYSPFAIDPRTLTEEQVKRFKDSPLLKKHKVFVKGGISADDSAALLGVNGGDNLLRILAKTPSRESAIETRVAKQAARLRKEAESAVDIDKTSLGFAFSRKLANNLSEMELLWNTSRGELKAGIKRIAKALPRKQDIVFQASEVVKKTPIGKLNANQHKIAERKARNKAVDAVMKNDLETAFNFKGAETLNGELSWQTHKAISQVNKAKRFFARLETKEVQAELRNAGDGAWEAWLEVRDTFKLTGSAKDVEESGSFAKYAQKVFESGTADITIPERLSDPRTHVSELTVEQVLALESSLRGILQQARLKNELIKRHGRDPLAQKTREMHAREIIEVAQKNPDYDETKAVSKQAHGFVPKAMGGGDQLVNYLFMNLEHLVEKIDGKVAGVLHKAIVAPLQGSDGQGGGLVGKANDMVEFTNAYKKAVERFGKKEFARMGYNEIEVPEFKDIPQLNNGKMTEAKLFMMLLNMGTDGNKQTMADNFGVSVDTINQVLNRHLTERHAVMAQSIFNMYKTLWPRVAELQRKTKGITPEMVQATSFSIGGKSFDGGYFPRTYSMELDYMKLKSSSKDVLNAVTGDAKIDMGRFNFADDMTRQGHTMKRVGSDRPINLDISMIGMGFETVLHDLNMRLPIANAIKILTDSQVSKAVSSVVGVNGYKTMLNGVVRAATSVQMENNLLFSSNDFIDKWRGRFRSGLSVAALAYRLPTMFIQPTSTIYSIEKMGKTGGMHVGMVLADVAKNPQKLLKGGELGQFASEILASVKLSGAEINETQRDPISKMTPRAYFNDPVSRRLSKYLKKDLKSAHHALADIQDVSIEFAFTMLQGVDDGQKTIVATAAYQQFMSGDAPGWSRAEIEKLSPKDREAQARNYAASIVRTTLTAGSLLDRAEIQNDDRFMIAMFFNDVRNAMANHLRQGRGVKHAWQDGRYTDSAALGGVMVMQMIAVKMFTDFVRGNATPFTSARNEYGEEEEEMYAEDWLGTTLKYFGSAPMDIVLGGTPVVRDIKFLKEKISDQPGRRIGAEPPMARMITDIAYTINAATDFLSIVNGEKELSNNEIKSIGYTASYLSGGLPVNALYDIYRSMEDGAIDEAVYSVESGVQRLKDEFKKFKSTQAKLDPKDRVPEMYAQAIEEVIEQVEPTVEGDRIPNSVINVIGEIESGGRWYAQNPNSTAAGTYQFLEGTWQWIMDSAPELELTRAGRTSADTAQQEKAMRWFTEHNARRLRRADIDVDIDSLYAAHFLGVNKAITVLSAPEELKIADLVSDEVMRANDFPEEMSVRSFKSWVKRKVANGKKALEDKQGKVDNAEQ